jgi:hypothetical protein
MRRNRYPIIRFAFGLDHLMMLTSALGKVVSGMGES